MAKKPTYEELEKRLQELERDELRRKKAEEALKHETDFRRVLGAIANEFITASSAAIDKSTDRALEAIGNFVGADRSYVIRFDFQNRTIRNTHEWCREGIEPQIENLQDLPIEMFGWVIDQLADLQVVHIPQVAGLPDEASKAKEEFEAEGIQSLLLVPLVSKGRCVGTVGFDFVTQARSYSEMETRLLHMSGVMLSNALDRKQAEDALRESEEKYRTILESIEDGYFEVDKAGSFTFFNESVCDILGYSQDELMGMNNRQYTDEENAKKLYSTFSRVYASGKPAKGFDWEIIRKNGEKRHVEASVSLRKDSEGLPNGFRGIVRDVTERKHVEKVLENEKERFRILVEKSPLGVALIRQDGRYKYLNPKFIEIFGYTLKDVTTGREWFRKAYPDNKYRNQVISIWINDQKEFGVGESRPRKFTVKCKDGTEKIINFRPVTMETGDQFVICEDITGTALLEAKLQQAQKMEAIGTLAGGVAHDLNTIISEQLKSPEFEKLISFHPNVQVETRFEKDLLNVKGSTTHLSKSVMNLLSNAAEAMPDGGKITISTENRYVDRPVKGYEHIEEGDYVVVTVRDTGIGMSKKDMEKIFEPFYTKKVMGRSGTGLGMAVVWGTVKDHKGYIESKSDEGKGTTFILYFPVTREENVTDKSLPSIEDYMGNGESLLVVDDVEEQRDIAFNMLGKLDYTVNTVSSGEGAIDYLKNRTADLLVLDMIREPGIDGLETYKRIIESHPNQKAIIASGYSETDRVKEAQRLGAGQYIKKPYTLERIGLAVKEELEK